VITFSSLAETGYFSRLSTDENMQVGNVSVAKLELTMGGQTIVIGEVTRSKVDYKLLLHNVFMHESPSGFKLNFFISLSIAIF